MKDKTKANLLLTMMSVGIILLIFLATWEILSEEQRSRYDIKTNNCSDITRDCRKLFDSLGIKTSTMYGHNYNETGSITSAHKWLLVHTIFGDFEFEPTILKFEKVSDRYDSTFIR